MDQYLLVALAGFAASIVDGALGMGFGPTSSTILLGAGLPPAIASTTVNLAKVAAGLASGVSHWRFGNVDRRLVLLLAIPGSIGACLGALALTRIDTTYLRPLLAGVLLLAGVRILLRFSRPLPSAIENDDQSRPAKGAPKFDERGVQVAALAGGVTNGLVGAWGPVVTPFLLARGLPPRYAVGSVNTAEVAVAAVSVVSLVASMGMSQLDPRIVIAMVVGGVLGAPLAAWVIRYIPPRALGLAVAGLLLLTSARDLANWAHLATGRWLVYGLVSLGIVLATISGQRRAPASQAG
jgi:uncharacterized membrane protein YfcA